MSLKMDDAYEHELAEALAYPDKRRARIIRDCANVLAQYHAAAAGRTIGATEKPDITPELISGFAEWMMLQDAAFKATVETLWNMIEGYISIKPRRFDPEGGIQ